MQWRNDLMRYGIIGQLLHWLVVGLIISQFVLANIFEDMPLSLEKIAWIVRHKELGMTVLLLAALRLIWRWLNPVPALPNGMRSYERLIAHITHWALYLLIFAIPLSGWLMSSLANIPVSYFGLFDFPHLIAANKTWVDFSKDVHEWLTTALFVIVLLHAAAALKHHFILKDDVLKRMLPRFKQ